MNASIYNSHTDQSASVVPTSLCQPICALQETNEHQIKQYNQNLIGSTSHKPEGLQGEFYQELHQIILEAKLKHASALFHFNQRCTVRLMRPKMTMYNNDIGNEMMMVNVGSRSLESSLAKLI